MCASLLIRCYKAPVQDNRVLSIQEVDMQEWRSKGLIIDPPDYQDGVYNTTYCYVSQIEQALFDIKSMRNNPPMRQVVEYLQSLRGRIGSRVSYSMCNLYRAMLIYSDGWINNWLLMHKLEILTISTLVLMSLDLGLDLVQKGFMV